MSVVPCKFYASGNCRYGNNCRFYHEPRNQQTAGGFFGNRTLAPATFQAQGVSPNQNALNLSKTNSNLDIIIEQVKKDMQEWQACKIWPYSCYGPVGSKVCVPGFEDLSPEEFRLAYMQSGNNVPPEVIQRFQQINQMRVNYQQSTMENRTIIERIVKADSALSVAQTVFGGGTQTSQPQAASIFGGTATQQPGNLFGGSSAFGQQQQQQPQAQTGSIFGGSFGGNTVGQQQPSSGNLFQAQPPANSGLFGAQPQAQSAFGTVQTQQPSLFQQPQQQQQTGLFQQQATATQQTGTFFQQPGQAAVGNVFQQQPVPAAQGSFFQQPQVSQQQPAPGLFQQPQVQQSQPGSFNLNQNQQQQQQLGSTFPTPTSNIFGGGTTQQAPATVPGGNIFGGSAASFPQSGQGGIQQQQQIASQLNPSSLVPQKFVYSDESELTKEDVEAFQAQDFSIETLPLKPPPQSLCV